MIFQRKGFSPTAKRKTLRIIPFGVIWLIFSLVYSQLEKGLLGDLDYYPSTGNPYNFSSNLFITSVFALATGLLIGIIETHYFSRTFIQKSFTSRIILKSIIYLTIIVSFLAILSAIGNIIELQVGILNAEVWSNVGKFVTNYAFVSVVVYIGVIVVVCQFYTEVSESIGLGVLANFFTGKYHKPIEEERIFMFLDMRSSTTIAERLGHVKYFSLLNAYYTDISDPIVRYNGEIYQYVGDEIIVSWTQNKGLHNSNCIKCFYEMKSALEQQSRKYHQHFGLLPEFKAGLHIGKVTTGEIGVIKKEIIFTGDVLNTTARIQGLCNDNAVDIIISDALLHRLNLGAEYQVRTLGESTLRGKDEKIELFTITYNAPGQ